MRGLVPGIHAIVSGLECGADGLSFAGELMGRTPAPQACIRWLLLITRATGPVT